MTTRFLALFDAHYGKQRIRGRTEELHDPGAIGAVLQFAQDFKPHVIVLGGDMLDCGAVSHWTREKPRATEGLRLVEDMAGCRREILAPLEALTTVRQRIYLVGNHEDWLEQFVDQHPGVEGLVGLDHLVRDRWTVVPQGKVRQLGKLRFIHGDTLRTQNPAKYAIETYEKSIRFGHFHRATLWTKISALDVSDVRTGMGVPGLCRRDPVYGHGQANQWTTGFLWGYIHEDGNFNDYLTFIANDRFTANGKTYRG